MSAEQVTSGLQLQRLRNFLPVELTVSRNQQTYPLRRDRRYSIYPGTLPSTMELFVPKELVKIYQNQSSLQNYQGENFPIPLTISMICLSIFTHIQT